MTDTRLADLDAPITTASADALEGKAHFEAISAGSAETLSLLLCGRLDYPLRCALFTANFQRSPEVVRDLMGADITLALEMMKDDIRSGLMEHINKRNAQGERRSRKSAQQLQLEKAATQFRAMSKPAPEGTVAELAERYGVSKTHVRLLKRENRLHELTQQ